MPPLPRSASAPFNAPTTEERFRSATAERRGEAVTVLGLAFSPGGRHLLASSSTGLVCVWDLGGGEEGEGEGAEVPPEAVALLKPAGGGGGPVAGVSFSLTASSSGGDGGGGGGGGPSLVLCTAGGLHVVPWERVLRELPPRGVGRGAPVPRLPLPPGRVLRMHPSPPPRGVGGTTEAAAVAVKGVGTEGCRVLCAASDDGFGTYCWRLGAEAEAEAELLGTLRAAGRGSNARHSAVAAAAGGEVGTVLLTAGDGGRLEIWDGPAPGGAILASLDVGAELVRGEAAGLVGSDGGGGGRLGGGGKTPPRTAWISALDVSRCGSWAAVGGGYRSGTGAGGGGFVAAVHLPTRSLGSGSWTREAVHAVRYVGGVAAPARIVSAGNEGAVSTWRAADLAAGRVGRAWTSTPNAYAVAVAEDPPTTAAGGGSLMAVAGTGPAVDCFADGCRVFSLRFPSSC